MNGFPAATAPTPRHPRRLAGDVRLAAALRRLLVLGAVLVLLVPAARGYNPWLGWMPLWLLGMPLGALWALHRFRLPPWQTLRGSRGTRRRRGSQARRRRLHRISPVTRAA